MKYILPVVLSEKAYVSLPIPALSTLLFPIIDGNSANFIKFINPNRFIILIDSSSNMLLRSRQTTPLISLDSMGLASSVPSPNIPIPRYLRPLCLACSIPSSSMMSYPSSTIVLRSSSAKVSLELFFLPYHSFSSSTSPSLESFWFIPGIAAASLRNSPSS